MPLTNRVLVAASIVFGATVAILAVADVSWMPTFAAIGAIALGAGWALRGALDRTP